MSFWNRIFGYKKSAGKAVKNQFTDTFSNSDTGTKESRDENVVKLLELRSFIDTLLSGGRYIAKSDYTEKISGYVSAINFFKVLKESGMLEEFCGQSEISGRQTGSETLSNSGSFLYEQSG